MHTSWWKPRFLPLISGYDCCSRYYTDLIGILPGTEPNFGCNQWTEVMDNSETMTCNGVRPQMLFFSVTHGVVQEYALRHATRDLILFVIFLDMFSSYNSTSVTVNITNICEKLKQSLASGSQKLIMSSGCETMYPTDYVSNPKLQSQLDPSWSNSYIHQ
jgi:hypothetical protein